MIKAFQAAISPRSKLPPSDWAATHVKLPRSTDSTTYRPEFTPWWEEVMREVVSTRTKEVCVTTPVGSGKSTMLEVLACYVASQRPGPMLITGQTDSDVDDWGETGLWPAMRACEPIAHMIPTARGKMRKSAAILPGMDIHLTGANFSGLQSKSKIWVFGDEVWMWKSGMCEEMRKRTHRRWNGKVFLLGQAGWLQEDDDGNPAGDDWTVAHHQGEQREWCFACPQCGDIQPYVLAQLKFPDEGTIVERARAAVYECANCSTSWDDTPRSRRAFATRSRYEVMREAILPGHVSFHLNVLALFRSPWMTVALEFLQATEAMKAGNSLPLQQFTQKQLAEPWREELSINRPNLDLIDERAEDYHDGRRIDGETARFLTVDVQRDHYWVACRAWRGDGSSVVLYYGKIQTDETIEQLRARMCVDSNRVYIDSGYDAGRVYDICARRGWVAIKGDKVDSYPHIARKGGKTIKMQRLMSKVSMVLAPCNKRVPLIHLAVDPLKDMLSRLRAGEAARWQAVEDIGTDYAKQLDSESKEEFLNSRTNQATQSWVKRRRHNHAWDCEVYQVAAALIWRVFGD